MANGDSLEDAVLLLRRAIALDPKFVLAYADLASLLCRLERADEAISLLDEAIENHPHEVWPFSIKAAVLSTERRAEEALLAHEAVVARAPNVTVPWINYAHALKTVGRTEQAVAAYRKSLEFDSSNGSAWWGLANLRTVRLGAGDVAVMQQALKSGTRDPLQQVQLQFALGKALGDLGDYEQSFRHYEEANRLRGTVVPYDPTRTSEFVQQCEAVFTSEFYASRNSQGCDADDVIFIVGMPRSGSTLVEQILASHPMIEGAGELFELRNLADTIARKSSKSASLPDAIVQLNTNDPRFLGESYLRSSRRHRHTDRPFFTDKMPANWQLVPFIHLILPNAKIIDVRRPLPPCCLSSFATYFNGQTSFPTKLKDLAGYYGDYVRLMSHMDAVLPGRVHRVDYENLVEDVETETRRLLAYLGLPFDPACLHFDKNPRAVHTPSAQQVREPINRDGLDRWRNYEPWLAPALRG